LNSRYKTVDSKDAKAAKAAKKAKKEANADKPKAPVGGAYGIFVNMNRAEIAKTVPAGSAATAVSKVAGERWKAMPEKEKAVYEAKYKEKKAAYEKELEAWKATKAAEQGDDDEDDEAALLDKMLKDRFLHRSNVDLEENFSEEEEDDKKGGKDYLKVNQDSMNASVEQSMPSNRVSSAGVSSDEPLNPDQPSGRVNTPSNDYVLPEDQEIQEEDEEEEEDGDRAKVKATTRIMADELTDHFEINFTEDIAVAPKLYGGYKNGSIVGVLSFRVWT